MSSIYGVANSILAEYMDCYETYVVLAVNPNGEPYVVYRSGLLLIMYYTYILNRTFPYVVGYMRKQDR